MSRVSALDHIRAQLEGARTELCGAWDRHDPEWKVRALRRRVARLQDQYDDEAREVTAAYLASLPPLEHTHHCRRESWIPATCGTTKSR